MTSKMLFTLAIAICGGLITVHAADKEGGPKGGRLLERTKPKAEFFVENDKTISINFYDAANKPVPVADQSVTVIAEEKGGKQKIDFGRKGDSLVSKTKLPEGEGYNLIVQFKQTPDAKPQNYRFKFDPTVCAKCKRAEYACICDE
jgi:hypothetical protein